jgi:hypothetical protein
MYNNDNGGGGRMKPFSVFSSLNKLISHLEETSSRLTIIELGEILQTSVGIHQTTMF